MNLKFMGFFYMRINTIMKISEVTNKLNTYLATVKVNGTFIKTSITAESSTHARLLLQRLYGTGNVGTMTESSTELDEDGSKVTDAGALQVKALADQAKRLSQQKKQLQARQAMAKAQEKIRDATKL
jgi:hypothetical protein